MKHTVILPLISIIGLAALIMILNLTSPTDIGPFGVLLFFTTLYIVLFGVTSVMLNLYYYLTSKRESMRNKDYLYAAVVAFGPIMLMMAYSFGVVNPWTLGLILMFIFLAEFLVMKRA